MLNLNAGLIRIVSFASVMGVSMSRGVPVASSRVWPRLIIATLLAGATGACSSDRFTGNPFSNPFSGPSTASYDPAPTTGSIAPAPMAPSGSFQAQDLPPVGVSAAPAPRAPAAAAPAFSTPRPQVAATGPAGWSAQGGTPIVVAQGETLGVIANRYSIPASAILSANGLSNASQITPGQRIVIPVYQAGGSAVASQRVAPAAPAQPVARTAAPVSPNPRSTVQTLRAPAAPAKPVPPIAAVKPAPVAKLEAKPVAPVAAPKPTVAAAPAAQPAPAKAAEAPKPAAAPAPVAAAPAKAAEPEAADQTASIARDGTEFRWPARGRIIAGFNGKGGNEGINIALPEGTPVKATESGTVAYAGSELKGYGNLVLIRHDNGFVSAYAHNGELLVKRGEKVRRGQVVAKSGQSGNVASPQLHFELRKGSTPVDPIQHLTGL